MVSAPLLPLREKGFAAPAFVFVTVIAMTVRQEDRDRLQRRSIRARVANKSEGGGGEKNVKKARFF